MVPNWLLDRERGRGMSQELVLNSCLGHMGGKMAPFLKIRPLKGEEFGDRNDEFSFVLAKFKV